MVSRVVAEQAASAAIGYSPDAWHDLFVALAGATAALAGLIFVAVALNNERILQHPRLPGVAGRAIATLIALVLMSTLALTPGQSTRVLGAELAALGLVLTVGCVASSLRSFDDNTPRSWRWQLVTATALSTGPMIVTGVSLLAEHGGGLYWALGESIAGIIVSVYYAWVLLVEIMR